MNIKIDILESNDESYDKSILELYEKRNTSKNSLNKRSIEDVNTNSKEENFTKTVNILNREKESMEDNIFYIEEFISTEVHKKLKRKGKKGK